MGFVGAQSGPAATAGRKQGSRLTRVFFVCDLHGNKRRYEVLLQAITREVPRAVFVGGDMLPSGPLAARSGGDHPKGFILGFLVDRLSRLRADLGHDYPRVFVILGNDDVRSEESSVVGVETGGLWTYLHNRKFEFETWSVYGYAYVAPTPFLLKDWERYDVSRYVDPGCISPEDGYRTVDVSKRERKHATIKDDLAALAGDNDLSRAVFLFHSPPYETKMDRASLDGKTVEGVPMDVHVGSIAIRRFIEARQPMLTLHGHVHESARLTGAWQDRIGRTILYSAAHDGPELALIRIDLDNPAQATRELL
jgi:Icc-related predicted phosphoesterase